MRTIRSIHGLAAIFVALTATTAVTAGEAQAKKRSVHSRSSCLPGVLKHRLNQIRSKFGGVRVISTYRRGARIAGSGRRSLHASCRAVDFHPPRGKYRAVANWLKRNHGGGVGTYSCGLYHIHIDNGPRVRFHKCGKRRRGRRYAGKRR